MYYYEYLFAAQVGENESVLSLDAVRQLFAVPFVLTGAQSGDELSQLTLVQLQEKNKTNN